MNFVMSRPLILAAVVCLMRSATAQTPWPVTQYNPQAAPDDVVLPMPCGGAMTFRRVNVPAANALDDRRVQIGSPDGRYSYAENTRITYVGGGFQDPKQKSQRYYLIGKSPDGALVFPVQFVIMLVIAAVVAFFLHRTARGRHWYAIGYNEQAAKYAGVTRAIIALILSIGMLANCHASVYAPSTDLPRTSPATAKSALV